MLYVNLMYDHIPHRPYFCYDTAAPLCVPWYFSFPIATREKRRLEAFEIWCYRKVSETSQLDMVPNEEVLKLV